MLKSPSIEAVGQTIRVLHLTAGNMYGGIESALTNLARLKHLSAKLNQEFGLCFPGRQRDELLAANVRVHDLGAVRFSRPWTILAARTRLRRTLVHFKIDTVITHGSWMHSIAGPVVRQQRIPLVTWVHGTLDPRRPLERIASWTRPDLVIANSYHTQRAASKVFSKSPIEVVYFPIAPQRNRLEAIDRERERAALGVRENQKVIFIASRIEPGKGHGILIESLGKLNDRDDWVCWIVGGPQGEFETNYFESLRNRVSALGIDHRVNFMGSRTDVPDLMKLSDIFCQPNVSPDSFGVSFVEALYAGLPVVTSNLGGGAEIVDETCGILTRPNDVSDVAGAIQSLLEDPARHQRLASHGPRRADQLCNPNHQYAKLEAILADMCFKENDK